jgi:hypothetical protein
MSHLELDHVGNENHECSNSAFLQRKNRKSVLAVCAIATIERTDRQGYPNCQDYDPNSKEG